MCQSRSAVGVGVWIFEFQALVDNFGAKLFLGRKPKHQSALSTMTVSVELLLVYRLNTRSVSHCHLESGPLLQDHEKWIQTRTTQL
jgi:hypothetical protein